MGILRNSFNSHLLQGRFMKVGIPREIKVLEYRVGMVPSGVAELVHDGHEVIVETNAGAGIGMTDADYQAAGAKVVETAKEVFAAAELIVKVKEPQLDECDMLRPDQILFTYLHLAADPDQAEALVKSGVTAIAYETVTANDGSLPLLAPMSQVAGRMSVQVGAHCLQNSSGGAGVLLGGVPGVAPGKVVILGGGVAGGNALEMAVGLQADVTVLDKNLKRLGQLSERFGSRIRALYSTTEAIEREVLTADLVIGAVLVAGAAAPKLVSRAMVAAMRPGSVLVDIAVDQGGCFETSRPTTHADPTYVIDGVVHYCVTNMPGAVARTSTFALNNATLPYVIALAEHGTEHAMRNDPHLAAGLNVKRGSIQHAAVARDLGLEYVKGIAA
jgi:alanine dehydrogenase